MSDDARTPVTPQRQLERNAEVLKQRDDALERIVQLEDEYKYTRAAIREGLSEAENIAYPVTREKVLFIRQQRDKLLRLVESLRDWKSPDGVLQVKDLKWFKDLPKPPEATC